MKLAIFETGEDITDPNPLPPGGASIEGYKSRLPAESLARLEKLEDLAANAEAEREAAFHADETARDELERAKINLDVASDRNAVQSGTFSDEQIGARQNAVERAKRRRLQTAEALSTKTADAAIYIDKLSEANRYFGANKSADPAFAGWRDGDVPQGSTVEEALVAVQDVLLPENARKEDSARTSRRDRASVEARLMGQADNLAAVGGLTITGLDHDEPRGAAFAFPTKLFTAAEPNSFSPDKQPAVTDMEAMICALFPDQVKAAISAALDLEYGTEDDTLDVHERFKLLRSLKAERERLLRREAALFWRCIDAGKPAKLRAGTSVKALLGIA